MAKLRRPESVLVVVHTHQLHCLLLERVSPPDFWQSVTGSLRWDEAPGEAARRELREETGLDPAALKDAGVAQSFPILPAWRERYAPDVEHNTEHVYYLALDAPVEIRLAPREHRAYDWLPVDAAIAKVASWTNRDALIALKG